MAYLARIEPLEARPVVQAPKLVGTAIKPAFSALEWSIIRLARVDGLSTLRAPGRISRFVNWLLGKTGSPELANPRLEALRRISVLSWHFGFSVPGADVAEFLAAGFTPEQYELLVNSVRAVVTAPARRIFA